MHAMLNRARLTEEEAISPYRWHDLIGLLFCCCAPRKKVSLIITRRSGTYLSNQQRADYNTRPLLTLGKHKEVLVAKGSGSRMGKGHEGINVTRQLASTYIVTNKH